VHREVVMAFLMSAVAAIPVWAQAQVRPRQKAPAVRRYTGQATDVKGIVGGLERAQGENRQHYRAYTLVRDYRLFSGRDLQPKSDVVAEISFVPPARKTFTIDKVIGASRGESIVRKILEHEVKTTAQDQGATVLNRENYDFVFLGMSLVDGHSCYVLQLQPKHKREDLVSGRGWIDAETYLPRLIDGDLAKNPSWWLKRVHLTLRFAEVGGMWLQTGTRAEADVRIFGEHTLTSKQINYQSGSADARNQLPPSRRRSAERTDLLGAGVFAH
jgi:hypothetical protein